MLLALYKKVLPGGGGECVSERVYNRGQRV